MNNTKKLVLSALFLTLGLVLPFMTGQIPQIGSMMLPMHIPVLLCGFCCGWKYGLLVGGLTPIIRSLWFGMPFMVPHAVCMAFELAAYGVVSGILYHCRKKTVANIYVSLVSAMAIGRLVWAIASYVVFAAMGSVFTMELFLAGAFVNAIPGIIIQLILIPAIIMVLRKSGVMDSFDN